MKHLFLLFTLRKSLLAGLLFVLLMVTVMPLYAAPLVQTDPLEILLIEAYEKYEAGDYVEAIPMFQQIVDKQSDEGLVTEALLGLGLCYVALDEHEMGMQAWKIILKDYPDSEVARLLREDVLGDNEDTKDTPCDDLNYKALAFYDQNEYLDALTKFQQASLCYQEIGDRIGEGNSLNNIGHIYSNLGQYNNALNYYEQALVLAQEVDDRAEEGTSLNNIGTIYNHLGQYDLALEYYQRSLVISREMDDRVEERIGLNNIGTIYNHLGKYDLALEYYQRSLVISREMDDRAGEATSLNNIGNIYDHLSRYEEALDYHQQALTIRQEIGNQAGEGVSLNNIGSIYIKKSQYKTALDYFRNALTITQQIGNRAYEGVSLNNIGAVYDNLGQYNVALDYYQQALTIRQEIDDRAGEGDSLNNIGTIYGNTGRYQTALDYFKEALSIQREIGYRAREANTLNNIAYIYDRQGRYDTALDYYQRGLIVRKEVGDYTGEGDSLNNIGHLYFSLGQYEAALDYYQRALSIHKKVGDRSRVATVLNNIGMVHNSDGPEQYNTALNYYQQALTIRQEISDQAGQGESLNNIGYVYSSRGQYDAALDYYQQALTILQEIDDRAGEGAALNNIGSIFFSRGQYDTALKYYEQALDIRQQTDNRVGEGTSLNNIGSINDTQGQTEAALDYFQQAIAIFETVRAEAGSEQGRAEFIARYDFLYRNTVDLLNQQKQPKLAFLNTEQGRARALLDSLATGQVFLKDNDAAELLIQEQEAYAHRQAIRFELTEAKANAPDRVTDLEQQLTEANAVYEAVQDAIATHDAELAALVPGRSVDKVLSVEQVQPLLDDKTTLVSYYQLEDNILAFILTGNSFETVTLDVDPTDVTQQINAFREFANTTAAHPASAVELYEMLVAPLRDKLRTPSLTIIPHQSLHYLPFAALTDGERYLLDDYTLTVLPNASALPFIQENAQLTAYGGQPSALIAGNPVTGDYDTVAALVIDESQYRDGLGSLPFAEKEAKAIAELFGVEPLIGEDATEIAVREQVAEANILHLAAHGVLNEEAPLYSLIALAPDNSKSTIENPQSTDGWLTVGESYGLNLENTDLVVLSACETNLGDLSAGDELVGLTRALIFAGTPSVIASLWEVEDEATSLLMERFYTHLNDGASKAEALRQAQIEVRKEYPNPYYWSGFVLSGDPGDGLGSAGAGKQGAAANSDERPAVVEDEVTAEAEAESEATPVEASEGQASGNCFSLLLILGAMASVGVVVRRQAETKAGDAGA